MSAITLSSAQAHLDAWLAASIAVAAAQSYEISTPTGTRKLTSADAAEIRNMIVFWETRVNRLSGVGRKRLRYFVPSSD
ncbi:MAG: DUF6148 family protein [Pseudorhodoplanes sp.]|uniref:DUF6148 family protein n=1 Tax=Pseudorhodoplanes sp. TaxID=1934341 RepID=UPI003D0C61AD